MPNTDNHVISEIGRRIVDLIETATTRPELRHMGRLLANEFAACKLREGLEAPPAHIDVEGSARKILKQQTLCLYAGRQQFPPIERECLEEFATLVSKL